MPGQQREIAPVRKKTLVILIWGLLTLVAGAAWFPGLAAAQTSVVQPIGNLINTWSVDQANAICKLFDNSIIPGKTDPFGYNTPVTQIDPTQTLHFVRFVNSPSDMLGGWVMRSSEVRGLTPAQIADKFALPNGTAPKYIVSVDIPASPQPPNLKYGLLTGIAGAIWDPNDPNYQWGHGGGQQTRIIKGQTQDATYNFMDYAKFIPTSSYYHLQPIGASALLYTPMVGAKGNAGRVAGYLDRFIPAAYSDLENVYTTLDYLNYADFGPGPLTAALNQIGPERYSSLSMLGQRNSLLFGDALLQRNQAIRQGWAGGELSGKGWGEGLGRLAQMAYVCGFTDPRLVSTTLPPSPEARRGLGLWARGVGEFGNQASGSDFTGFGYNTGGVVGGADYQPRPDVVVGFGTGYLGSNLNWNNNGGQASVSNAKFGLYATYFTPHFFLDGVFSGGVNWTSSQRSIVFPGVIRQASSNQTGHDLALHLQGGVNLPVAGWELTPLARLSYFYLGQDAFTEQGADSLNLTVQGFSAQTLRSQLGLRAGRTFATQGGVRLRPELQLAWAHDFPLDNRVINAGLTELGGTFPVNGFRGETDSLLAGAGLSARLTNDIALTARYDAELRRGFQSQMVNLGARFDF